MLPTLGPKEFGAPMLPMLPMKSDGSPTGDWGLESI
jgi:hypothetical protein